MPSLLWDEGTAYDLFVSLYVLHQPAMFGVRPSWAAGVRSRLPAVQRDFLEQVLSFLPVPLSWLYLLPAEARTAADALHTLAQTRTAERLPSLLFTADHPIEAFNILQQITLRQTCTSAEQEVLRAALLQMGIQARPNTIANLCSAWLDLTASGEQLLQALNTYYEVFYQEEEKRIQPFLQTALDQSSKLAQRLPVKDLLAELSHGVHFEQVESLEEVILVPSYWSSPLVFYSHLPGNRLLVLFGAHPEYHDLTPGETLPQDLVGRMKAIADPTRLRILRYLSDGPQTPSELARRLRLRPPTVTYHLNELRLAGLVEITLHAQGERAYSLHRTALNDTISLLIDFLTPDPESDLK